MSVHHFKRVQNLPISLEAVWDFFSNPQNLKEITPAHIGFEVRSDPDFSARKMYAGQVISYTVRPLLGIPLFWMTEITHVEHGHFFVDEQRVGPYALWHHQHHFRAIPGGVEMTDLVHYRVPFGWLGDFANWLFVRRQLEGIFDFRKERLEMVFGEMSLP
ncbi:MAG: SRPBCC family protein [Saprospiraceae bacterium]